MKTLCYGMLGACLVVGALSVSSAGAEDVRVYYKGGTQIEFPDQGVQVKLNTQLQPRYTFEANDVEKDVSTFSVRRARIQVGGEALNGGVSFKLQNEFAGSSGLRDAYIQFNHDDVALRMGQFKVPFSAQELVSSTSLQFIDRSLVSNNFAPSRDVGAMVHGSDGALGWALGVFNGEGVNARNEDTKVLGAAAVNLSANGYNRGYEGDVEQTDGVAWTVGAAGTFEQRNEEIDKVDILGLNADIGLRSAGLSLQSEIFYRLVELDSTSDDSDELGVYVQAGYFLVPREWEVAGRFGWLRVEDFAGVEDDTFEYSLVLNRFLNGHYLKVQTGVTWEQFDPDAGESIDDIRAELQVAGYF